LGDYGQNEEGRAGADLPVIVEIRKLWLKRMPKVSVIVPVYNADPRHLAEALSSIVWALPADGQVVIGLDGGCSVECMEVLERINSGTNRKALRIISGVRQGISGTLNMLIDHCDCEYIARSDADDICLPNRFANQLSALQANSSADFCGMQILRCTADLVPFRYQRCFPISFTEQLIYAFCLNNPIAHPSLMIRRNILDKSPYRAITGAEDWDLYIRLWMKKYKSFNLRQIGLLYRVHSQQTTKKARSGQIINDLKERSFEAAIANDKRLACLYPIHQIARASRLSQIALYFKNFINI